MPVLSIPLIVLAGLAACPRLDDPQRPLPYRLANFLRRSKKSLCFRCAGAIRDSVRLLNLEVRCGLHTGECELLGNDLAGIAVHTGARVAGLAAPGEILVSQTVRDLVAGSGLTFENRGTHALKGIPNEWCLFRVTLN